MFLWYLLSIAVFSVSIIRLACMIIIWHLPIHHQIKFPKPLLEYMITFTRKIYIFCHHPSHYFYWRRKYFLVPILSPYLSISLLFPGRKKNLLSHSCFSLKKVLHTTKTWNLLGLGELLQSSSFMLCRWLCSQIMKKGPTIIEAFSQPNFVSLSCTSEFEKNSLIVKPQRSIIKAVK